MQEETLAHGLAGSVCSLSVDMSTIRAPNTHGATRRKGRCYRSEGVAIDGLQLHQLGKGSVDIARVRRERL